MAGLTDGDKNTLRQMMAELVKSAGGKQCAEHSGHEARLAMTEANLKVLTALGQETHEMLVAHDQRLEALKTDGEETVKVLVAHKSAHWTWFIGIPALLVGMTKLFDWVKDSLVK